MTTSGDSARTDASGAAGEAREGQIAQLEARLQANPDQAVDVYRSLGILLLQAGRLDEGAAWARAGLQHHADAAPLWNLLGVLTRQAGDLPGALEAFDTAVVRDPDHAPAHVNRGNTLIQKGDARGAAAAFAALAERQPDDASNHFRHGQALARSGQLAEAAMALRRSVDLDPSAPLAWAELASALHALQRTEESLRVLDAAVARHPRIRQVLETKALILRWTGQAARAAAFLEGLEGFEEHAWWRFNLGEALAGRDHAGALGHLRRAVALAPGEPDYAIALAQALARVEGPEEGAALDEAVALGERLAGVDGRPVTRRILRQVFARACAFDALERLGSVRDETLAELGGQGGLLYQLARVRSHEDRLDLLAQHRAWGRAAEARAARAPIRRPARRAVGAKVRLGLMSSDLRHHPVGHFAQPIFDHLDRERFEVSVYAFRPGPPDALQAHIAAEANAFHNWPELSARDAAQRIADDDLDMLIELGGHTQLSRIEALAWRPALRQASWLGYPHSTGLSTIDWFLCDPVLCPMTPDLLSERPLVLPQTWLAFGRHAFADHLEIKPGTPEARTGTLTFGTANNPQKFNRELLRAWARIVAATPGSRFAFVRPEGGSAAFRRNIEAAFAAEGVGAERLVWRPVRGRHMTLYNEVDISLDTFPLTGGTTTAEALWMGVPVVTLVGEAVYERLSASILTNAGLGDLCTADLAGYEAAAVALAADCPRRKALRAGLRDQLRACPLGQAEAFARDFYDAVWRTVREG